MELESLQAIVNIIGTLGGQASTAFIVWVVAKIAGNWITALIVGGFILTIATKIINAIRNANTDEAYLKQLRNIVLPSASGWVSESERTELIKFVTSASKHNQSV